MRRLLTPALILAALAQFALSHEIRGLQPSADVIPPAPSADAVKARAFGDDQFLYRQLAHDLQNFGDTGGRVTTMRDYDPDRVLAWLGVLDGLDSDAAYHLFLTVRYFAQTPDPAALRRLIEYVKDRVAQNPERHAIWAADAIYIAQARLRDLGLAMEIGAVLDRGNPSNVPLIVRQLPAYLYERGGRFAEAGASMARIRQSWGDRATQQELVYMDNYIQQMKKWALAPPPAGAPYPPELRPLPPRG